MQTVRSGPTQHLNISLWPPSVIVKGLRRQTCGLQSTLLHATIISKLRMTWWAMPDQSAVHTLTHVAELTCMHSLNQTRQAQSLRPAAVILFHGAPVAPYSVCYIRLLPAQKCHLSWPFGRRVNENPYQGHVPHAVVVHDILAGRAKASSHVEARVAQAAEGRPKQCCGPQHQLPSHHMLVPRLHLQQMQHP